MGTWTIAATAPACIGRNTEPAPYFPTRRSVPSLVARDADTTRVASRLMMLAGVPVHADAVAELATMVRAEAAADLAGRLDGALGDSVALLAITIDERAEGSLPAAQAAKHGLQVGRCR